jgi:ATP-dependent DNA ligase
MTINNPQDNIFVWLKNEVALEPKIDGVRLQLHKQGKDIVMFSRFGNELTDKFPELVEKSKSFENDLILDGEVVCLNKDGSFDFYDVIRKIRGGEGIPVYFVFDILYMNGKVHDSPFLMRRELLEKLKFSFNIRLMPQWITDDATELKNLYVKMIQKGLEGIVVKDLEAPYYFNRTWFMKKLKPIRTIDLRITGVTKGKIDYHIYDVSTQEGLVGKITMKGNGLKIGEIVECKFDRFIPSNEYPMGKCLRFVSFVRKSLKQNPDRIDDFELPRVHMKEG